MCVWFFMGFPFGNKDNDYTIVLQNAMVSSSIGYNFSNWIPYQVPEIDWEEYKENTTNIIDGVVRELVAYDDFYWMFQIESSIQWEERLCGE